MNSKRTTEWDEERINVVGQNGNDGLHYDTPDDSAFRTQVAGGHYKSQPLQPIVIAAVNNLDPFQTHALKYMMRNKANPVEDTDKAIHMLQMRKEYMQNGCDPKYLLQLALEDLD